MFNAPPMPEALLPPLTDDKPPETLDDVEPADIWTEPPTPSLDVIEDPTEREMVPAWPLFPPPDPDIKEIFPEFPDVATPVSIVRSPDTPAVPESAVYKERVPEVVSSLLPLEICIVPP
jgi:hypothetical protein